MAEAALAVDLGGTNLRVATVTREGAVAHRTVVAARPEAGPDDLVARLADLVEETARAAGLDATAPLGIAMPGPLDPFRQVVAYMPNLPGWRDYAVGDAIRSRTGRPFVLGNDGNCAALGETRFGAARGVADLVHFALGTGVGGGIITGGRLVEGALGYASEVGHMVVAFDGPRCSCGSVGCLESYASGWAIAREGELVAATEDGAAIRAAAGGAAVTPRAIAAAAATGDPAATAILERAGRALGAAAGSLVNLFNPEMIVIGGGVGNLGEIILEPMRRELASHAFPRNREILRIVTSALGDDTGLLGAAALAFDRLAPENPDSGH